MLSLLNTKYHHVKALLKTFHLSGNIIGFSLENSNVRTARVLRLSGGGGGARGGGTKTGGGGGGGGGGGALRDETKTAARETD